MSSVKKIPWAKAELSVKNCGVTRNPPGTRIAREWFTSIRDFDFWVILSGRADAHPQQGDTLALARGSCLWLAPGIHYDFEVKEDELITAWVHFDLLGPDGKPLDPKQVRIPSPHSEILNSQMFEQVIRHIVLLYFGHRDDATSFARRALATAAQLLKGLLMEFELFQAQQASLKPLGIGRHHREVISEALSWIYFSPVEAVSASAVAHKFGYSLKHFCRIFREVSGKPPSRAIIEARIEHARDMLANTSLNIAQIADRLNYENAFYFSKQFKKVTGESPSQYRNRNAAA